MKNIFIKILFGSSKYASKANDGSREKMEK